MKVVLCLFRVFSQGSVHGKALDDFQIRRTDQVRAAAQVGNLKNGDWIHKHVDLIWLHGFLTFNHN